MNLPKKNFPILMVRDDMKVIPHFTLSAGYAFRWYEPGDEHLWVQVQTAAEPLIPITIELYRKAFATDPASLGERQVFLMDDRSKAVGTATAWFDDIHGDRECGCVHWVAIVPEKQGLGLAKPLMSVVCSRLRELGHRRAYLATSSLRIPAIGLYWLFGFRPQINNEADQAAWDEIRPHLKNP